MSTHAGTNIALLEYYITESYVLIFLLEKKLDEPIVFQKSIDKTTYSFLEYIDLCSQRLLIDFNGLPYDWAKTQQFEVYRKALSLDPNVKEYRRTRHPNYPGYDLFDSKYNFKTTYFELLSDIFFPEELKEKLKNTDLLCISPHKILHLLPLHALKWNKDQYIIEKFGICYTPSASVLKYCRAKNELRKNKFFKPQSCLVVCASTLQDKNAFDEDANLLSKFEWDKNFVVLKGSKATKDCVTKKIMGRDVIHFACHGLFGEDFGGDALDSGLCLLGNINTGKQQITGIDEVTKLNAKQRSKIILSAREIFSLSLDCNLVTLRACSSGRSRVTTGDELLGLSRALLYAGTSSLIVSLWNVHIESSRVLLNEFYRYWIIDSKPKWKALQLAQLSIKENEKFNHPYHWAPFILIGDWI